MKVISILTVGWQPGDPSALELHGQAGKGRNYQKNLLRVLGDAREIHGVEDLFHRRARGGAQPIKRFTAALVSAEDDRELILHLDVFAYLFLAHASNLDFIIPEDAGRLGPFRKGREAQWRRELRVYEEFERLGREPAEEGQRSRYLAMRRVLMRPSARDELRALAALLWSGPLTVPELQEDLALNWPLADRVLAPFLQTGILERREERIAIATESIPVVLFFLRELLGIDPLGLLDDGSR